MLVGIGGLQVGGPAHPLVGDERLHAVQRELELRARGRLRRVEHAARARERERSSGARGRAGGAYGTVDHPCPSMLGVWHGRSH